MVERLLHLTASAAAKQKRLTALLGGRDPSDAALREAVADAQLLGSLELAGFDIGWEQVRASRRGEPAPAPVARLRAAQQAVEPQAPFSVRALLAWHAAATGGTAGVRTSERTRDGGPPPAPAAFVAQRLAILEEWLGVESGRELKPAQAGALVLARILEILPFDEANGRVARLAASHLMLRAGGRAPILVKGDAPRLAQAVDAAFQLATEPLATLLDEAAERSLDVMIQTLERDR
jgi:Fic family protein